MPDSPVATTELLGDGLHLRPYRAGDAALLFAAVRESVGPVGRWLSWCDESYSEADAQAWIVRCDEAWRTGEQFAFAIFEAATSTFLGGVGLNQRNRTHNLMSLGYWVRASRQREGIAVRAARLVAAFGFQTIGLTRIEILAELDNRASRRVAGSLGASFEAIARNRLIARGTPGDAAVYALIP
jgi:RimJ/RimL family protein N-acetyltransferase